MRGSAKDTGSVSGRAKPTPSPQPWVDAFKLWCCGEDSWEPLGQQRDPTSPSWRRSVLGVHWKDWCWSWNPNTLATWCEQLTHLKNPWCWERLRAGGEGDNRGWDGWMVSPIQWTWVWVYSGSWWRTGRPSRLQSMRLQRVGHDWTTKLKYLAISFLENKIYTLNKFWSPIQCSSYVLPTKQFSNTSYASYHSIQFW